jgi:hypothetical protein
VKTEFLWQVPNYFDVDARGLTLASFFGPLAKLGAGSFYLNTYFDKNGGRLTGKILIGCASLQMFLRATSGR